MPKRTSISFLIILFFVSCDSKVVFDEYQTLPNAWSKDAEMSFKFEALDTMSTFDLFVNIRNNKDYKFSNLYLITGLEYPNGKTIIDTLEYRMAAPDGTLLGTGFSDVKESKLWYKGHKSDFVFNEIGTYTFKVQQAMRKYGNVNGVDDLEGVTEIGFRIENR